MRAVAVPLGLVGLLIAGLVAMNLGVDWAAWVAAGSVVVLAFVMLLSWLPLGGGFGGDG